MKREITEYRAAWERSYFDLWTIPHTLFGVIIALLAHDASVEFWVGFCITAALALGWEVFEELTGLRKEEYLSNSVSDIAVALAGYVAGALALPYIGILMPLQAFFVIVLCVWAAMLSFGWLTYYRAVRRLRRSR